MNEVFVHQIIKVHFHICLRREYLLHVELTLLSIDILPASEYKINFVVLKQIHALLNRTFLHVDLNLSFIQRSRAI